MTNKNLEQYFSPFRENIIGKNTLFSNRYGNHPIIYADYLASGRLYGPIEDVIREQVGPFMANTHSYSSETGRYITSTYKEARRIIKDHVHALDTDILVTTGTGMTGALSRLIRILNFKKNGQAKVDRPVVFITHLEHHSHHVPWMELDVDLVILEPDQNLNICPDDLEIQLEKYKDRKIKIGAFSACSNVTGIITPYQELARLMHTYDGLCFVDFAASAPYVDIDMHPKEEGRHLDAIYFSPHKFLGGPGSSGVLVFSEKLYRIGRPDIPGGGNVLFTNPWGMYEYFTSAEVREDGGTPGILQVIRGALSIRLKEQMGIQQIAAREAELVNRFLSWARNEPRLKLIGDATSKRIGCVSFTISGLHYNLIVRLLNDRFGIQVRGGWSCASTFAHYAFSIPREDGDALATAIKNGNMGTKPGWVRISLHPTMTNKELEYILGALSEILENENQWSKDYCYNPKTNEFESIHEEQTNQFHSVFKI